LTFTGNTLDNLLEILVFSSRDLLAASNHTIPHTVPRCHLLPVNFSSCFATWRASPSTVDSPLRSPC
jgi:hypothetical protein